MFENIYFNIITVLKYKVQVDMYLEKNNSGYHCVRNRYVMKYSYDYKNEREHYNYLINNIIDTNFAVQIHKKNFEGENEV